MDERAVQFKVGVVVVASIALGVLLTAIFGMETNPFQKTKTLYIDFAEAPGVMRNSPVRKSGVLIGRVTKVELKETGRVLVTAKIDADKAPRRNEFCRIGSGSLLGGDAVLEFHPMDHEDVLAMFGADKNRELSSKEKQTAKMRITDGDYISAERPMKGYVATDPMKVLIHLQDRLSDVMPSLVEAGNEVKSLAQNVNRMVTGNEEQVKQIIEKSNMALDNFNRAVGPISETLGDQQAAEDLKRAVRGLPQLYDEARNAIAGLQHNSDNLEKFTGPLGEQGAQMVSDLGDGFEQLHIMSEQLAQVAEAINSREGSIGMLVHDRELYDRLLHSAQNIEETSNRLRPILNDIRIFTDKIARVPGRLGLKGTLSGQGAGTKWVQPASANFGVRSGSSRLYDAYGGRQ